MKDFFLSILSWCVTSGIKLVLTLVVTFLLWRLIDYVAKKFVESNKFANIEHDVN